MRWLEVWVEGECESLEEEALAPFSLIFKPSSVTQNLDQVDKREAGAKKYTLSITLMLHPVDKSNNKKLIETLL